MRELLEDYFAPLLLLGTFLVLMLALIGLGFYDVKQSNETERRCLAAGHDPSDCRDR